MGANAVFCASSPPCFSSGTANVLGVKLTFVEEDVKQLDRKDEVRLPSTF